MQPARHSKIDNLNVVIHKICKIYMAGIDWRLTCQLIQTTQMIKEYYHAD